MEQNRRLSDEILISKLGFGAWAIGGGVYGDVAVRDANEALEYYLSQGGNFIDTARMYSDSERIIGEFLKESSFKQDVIIATKTACGDTMESVQRIETELEESLRNLSRDYVDVYYFHMPSEEPEVIAAGLDVMQKLKRQGKIRTIGASIKGPNVTDGTVDLIQTYIDTKQIDVIQLVYSILRQKNRAMFSHAMEHNVALVGRTSLESGFLTGKYRKGHTFATGDHRGRWDNHFDEIVDLVEELEGKFVGKYDDSLMSLALRFALAPEAITDTIVGAKNRKQMEEIINVVQKPAMDPSLLIALELGYQDKTELLNIR